MESITLLPVMHRGSEQILIRFEYHKVLNDVTRKLPGVKWSVTYKSWYLPLSEHSYQLIWKALRPLAMIETAELHQYLLKRKIVKATEVPKQRYSEHPSSGDTATLPTARPVAPQPTVSFRLSYENLLSLEQTIKQLTLKAYSNSTIRTYRGELMVFFQVLGKHPASSLTTEDVKRYLLQCISGGLTENTIHSRINALKFYYEQVLGREKFFVDVPRPKKHQQLPNVLGEQEITRLFNALTNKKHKAILFTAYSAGLRVSEVVSLKLKDIDSDRMQLFIERAKGKKDRYVNLSPILLDVLRGYIQDCQPRPNVFLFEGQAPGMIYSARAAQKVFQIARQKAQIKKEVSFHSLRHYGKCKIMGSAHRKCLIFRDVCKNTSHNFQSYLQRFCSQFIKSPSFSHVGVSPVFNS